MDDGEKFAPGFIFGIVVPMVLAMCGFWDLAFAVMLTMGVLICIDHVKERKMRLEQRLDR